LFYPKNASKILFYSILFFLTFTLISIPLTVRALTNSVTLGSGQMYYIQLIGSSGSFTSTGTVDAFIDTIDGVNYYSSSGTIPSTAIWQTTGTSGSFSGINIMGNTYYLVFGNMGISSVDITYTINVMIPGFEGFFAILAILGICTLFILKNRKIIKMN